jgi:hypothetical protein
VPPQILVVSDPPHAEVDHDAAAQVLGLAVGEARPKINFWAPEVLAASDPERATEAAAALRRAGLSVVVLDGEQLVDIPWPTLVSSFELGESALIARVKDYEVRLPYDLPILGVYCKPPADFPLGGPLGEGERPKPPEAPGGEGLATAEAIQWMSILDLYFAQGGEHERITIARDLTDFSALGNPQGPATTETVAATVAELQRRCTRLDLDTRLENVRPRQRFVMGEAGFDLDLRKRYSFGTLLLRQMLDSISPELRDLTQYELGSRLAYVLRHRG